jgi:DNA-binding winged helix-turn-helix (wHTH) protein/TolB-like protein
MTSVLSASSRECVTVIEVATERRQYRFGVFYFDADSGELSRDGRPIRLQPQPGQVLAALVSRAGEVVTRDDLRRAVWPDDTFVDFDRGLNFCIAQVRGALNDDATTPRYIRTVPKKGYEFICPVEAVAADGSTVRIPAGRQPSFRRPAVVALTILAAVTAGAGLYVAKRSASAVPIVAVARFDNETGDPALTLFGDALTDTVVEQLARESGGAYAVVGNAAILRRPREQRDLAAIASSLHAGYVVLAQVQRDAERVRVLSHLIHLPDQTHITVSRTDGITAETLAATDEIASRIALAFAPRVRNRDTRPASRGAVNH